MTMPTWVVPRREPGSGVGLAVTVVLVALAAAAGYFAARNLVVALLIVMLPIATWFVSQRRALVMVLAAVLPYTNDVSGGATGFNLAPSDLIMTILVAGLATDWLMTRQAPELRPLKPLLVVLATYVGLMLALLAFHLGLASMIKTGQRLDLFLFPLIIGVAIARWGDEIRFLGVYAVCSTGFSVAWYFFNDSFYLGQKNPIGQFVANAIIVTVAVKTLRRRLWFLLPVMVTMLFLTQSRGSIVSVGVAMVVFLLLQTGLNRVRSLVAMVPLAAVTAIAFRLLPEDVQARNTSFGSGTTSAADWAVHIRDQYHADAWQIIHSHPWTGIGVGRYLAGDVAGGTITTDPHQVFLQQAAEGGYLLAVAFAFLVIGTAFIVWRMRDRAPLGPLAVALHLAIVSHGLVDVYWVRGTPVLGWLVIGMALGQAMRPPSHGPDGPESTERQANRQRVLSG